MEYGIDIITVDENASEILVLHSYRLASDRSVYDAYGSLSWTENEEGTYLVEFYAGDEVLADLITDGAGVIAIINQMATQGVAA